MLKKKFVFLFVLLTLLVALAQRPADANCSGENCGCDYYAQDCEANCAPGDTQCSLACIRQYKACAIACCQP